MSTALFIRRPVMTTLLMAAIILFGVIAYRKLPVSDLPNVDFPTIQVVALLPGASPTTMASAVATPLERQFSTIAGLDNMTSTSSQGQTRIAIQFELDRNIDAAAQDVQAAIAKAQPELPADMPSPPSYRKVNPADAPIMYLAVSSATLPLYTVHEYAETMMAQRISTISGVAQVSVYGAQKYAVRIQVNPSALASRGIGMSEVEQAIARANTNLPTGTLYGPHQAFNVKATGQLTEAAAYRPIIVAYRNGSPVRLEQLGRALDSVENDKIAGWYRKHRAVVLAVQRQPGTNAVKISDAIRKLLPGFRLQIPPAVSLDIIYDRSASIRESVSDVEFTLMLTVALVILTIFLFIRRLSATLIPSLAVPFSIVGTFALMYLLGYSLDNLSLMALTLSVGFVVDDAIVMLENIVRHLEMGKSALRAAIDGAKEISFTIISMTLSLVAVFIPVLFMGGVVGRLLKEFSVTIGVAVLVSGVVSLTLTPMACSRFLVTSASGRHGWLYRVFERFFDGMLNLYRRTLTSVLRHPLVTMLVLVATIGGTAYLFILVPKGFIPTEDTGRIFAFTEAAQDISFEAMKRLQYRVGRVVLADPAVRHFFSTVGAGGPSPTPNTGILFTNLVPRAKRPHVDQIIARLRKKLARIPGIRVYLQKPPLVRLGGRLSKAVFQFTLQSTDLDELYRWAPVLEERLRKLPGFRDVNSDLQITSPEILVQIDRDRASAVGVTAQELERTLGNAYGTRQISTIYAPSNQYRVLLEVEPQYQRDPRALSLLYVQGAGGRQVPLGSVATLRRQVGPLTVNHLGQLPAVTISFNLEPGVALGDAVNRVEKVKAELRVPASVTTTFQGTAQAFQESLEGLGLLLLVAVLVIYLILGVLYESFIHPLTILSGLPAAGVGALATLAIFGMELDIYGFVGLIMLIGIVKKNAIMMIDFALDAEREGKSPSDAIYEGCLLRFRPIMMTTVTTMAGALPIALGYGAGAEARQPLGLAVVGGLIFSQILTLYITPVVYIYMDRGQRRVQRWWTRLTGRKPQSQTGSDAAE